MLPGRKTWPHLELLLGFSLLGFTHCQWPGELSRGSRGFLLWEVAWRAVSRGLGPGLRLGPVSAPGLSPAPQRRTQNDRLCICMYVLIRARVSDP